MRPTYLLALTIAALLVPATSLAESDLAPDEIRSILQAGFSLQPSVQFDTVDGRRGQFLALGDRFGRLSVYFFGSGSNRGRIWSSGPLDGNVAEVVVADLDSDHEIDHLVCRTPRRIYAFDLSKDFRVVFESLPDNFRSITAFTVGDVDSDPQQEIVVAADGQIHYLDGSSFQREWTSMDRYQVVRIRAGDVDGDRRVELVLDTGEVLDGMSGRVEWAAPDPFGSQLELLDLDGDGVSEIIGSAPGQPLRFWNGSSQRELRVH